MSNFFAGVCFGVAGMALLVLLDGIARKLVARARRRQIKKAAEEQRKRRKAMDFNTYWLKLGGDAK